jgi:NADPH-dependent glutamate synthase beta subunit-like oxidoreductase
MTASLVLSFDIQFDALYSREGLAVLDDRFIEFLRRQNPELHDRLASARATLDVAVAKTEEELIVYLAPALDDFVAELFGIVAEVGALRARDRALAPIYSIKRLFVRRRAAKKFGPEQAETFDGQALREQLERHLGGELTELRFAEQVESWMRAEAEHVEALDIAARYAAWATHSEEGKRRHGRGVLFKIPHKVEPERLVPIETTVIDGVRSLCFPDSRLREREGFALTDLGTGIEGALDQANYCIWCHNQFGVVLVGCSLEEKISEMNLVEVEGRTIGALAIAVIDNPMCAATGHRICNDCMKACIYQKQEPVDVPQIETRVLKNVLALPWGFEIYSLLTRWNPLNLRRPLPRPATSRKVLIVGLGPAGFTLAHHLINDGHTVVAIDGLKIEPLTAEISGVDPRGARQPFRPIRDVEELREPLGHRVMAGFGGVAEYGITVRWDKNFLKIIRLLLERRAEFKMFGGVRFGGALTIDSAFALGFDHIALCAGAGRPTIVPMKNGLAPGVRQASDFLIALQLTGAAKTDSVANLQVRLPVIVIGGGLTAIDTATESLAYYPLQVEKFIARYEALVAEVGEPAVREGWSDQEREVAEEFLAHARAIRAERKAAAREGRRLRLVELLRGWGGATIVYPRRLIDSPSYTLNHEEVAKAMEEGIRFAEQFVPEEVLLDVHGHARALCVLSPSGSEPGRSSKSRPARYLSPPEPSRTQCSAGRTPSRHSLMASISRRSTSMACGWRPSESPNPPLSMC